MSLITFVLKLDTEYHIILFDVININLNHCVEKLVIADDMNGDVIGCGSF